jgi:hypothetical protein
MARMHRAIDAVFAKDALLRCATADDLHCVRTREGRTSLDARAHSTAAEE